MPVNIVSALCGGLFLYLLFFPEAGFSAATSGLLLWYQTLVPTLFPVMILSNILLKTNVAEHISGILFRPFRRFVRLSPAGFYAVLIGFLCGCPMGAKTLSDLYKEKKISLLECRYLAPVINNISPAFLLNYLVIGHLQNAALKMPTLIILYSAPLFYASFFYKKYRKNLSASAEAGDFSSAQAKNKTSPTSVRISVVDVCISDSISNITKLGGYIVLFSILGSLIDHIPLLATLPKALLLGITEVSVGIHVIAALPLSFPIKYLLLVAVSAFGGLCCTAQSAQMLKTIDITVCHYLRDKLLIAATATLLAAVFLF